MTNRLLAYLAITTMAIAPAWLGQTPALAAITSDGSRPNQQVRLQGSVVPHLQQAKRLGQLAPWRSLSVAVTLEPSHQSTLHTLLHHIYDPHSRLYHHFLTPNQYAIRFGPSSATTRQAEQWLRAGGLHVISRSRNGLQLTARGQLVKVEQIFATSISRFQRHGKTFYANTKPVQVPATLAPHISSVTGLSNAVFLKPAGHFSKQTPHDGKGPAGGYTPQQIRQMYNVLPLNQNGFNGQGQTIAVMAFADYHSGHVTTFDKQYGITSTAERVIIDDGQGDTIETNNGSDETEMDLEVVQGMAPRANILVYEAPNTRLGSIGIWNQLVSDDRASIATTSWGTWEGNTSDSELHAVHNALQEAAAQGQTVFAATGDNGAFDQAQDPQNGNPHALAVDFPSSDPWITAVGGTSIIEDGSGGYGGETAWWDDSDPSTPTGTGGGLSNLYARPSYQSGPGVNNAHSNGKRQTPDVASLAGGDVVYAIYTKHHSCSSCWGQDGGTSASSPLWAAYTAVLQQALGRHLGFLNPLLYELGQKASTYRVSPFHDVTTGNNGFYQSTPGWDFTTGWGSFNGKAMYDVLSGTHVSSPQIVIDHLGLLHKVKGKNKATGLLYLGETGKFYATYHVLNGGSEPTSGRIIFTEGGSNIGSEQMKSGTISGKTAFVDSTIFKGKGVAHVAANFVLHANTSQATGSLKFTLKQLKCKKGYHAKKGTCVKTKH